LTQERSATQVCLRTTDRSGNSEHRNVRFHKEIVRVLAARTCARHRLGLDDLIAGRRIVFEEGAVLELVFSLWVATITGPVDGYLAHVIPQPLRAALSAVVGATTATFLILLILGIGGERPIPSEILMKIASFGAVCMGLCSLLSGPSRDELN
jgi:hypothetical protein